MSEPDVTLDEDGRCLITELLPSECACRFHATQRDLPSRRSRTGAVRHSWSRDDDLVVAAAYLERGGDVSDAKVSSLAELIGCSDASVVYKLGNLDAYVAGIGPLNHSSAQMRSVVDQLKRLDGPEQQRLATEATLRLGE